MPIYKLFRRNVWITKITLILHHVFIYKWSSKNLMDFRQKWKIICLYAWASQSRINRFKKKQAPNVMSCKFFLLFVTHTTKTFVGHDKINRLLISYDTSNVFRKDTLKHYSMPFCSWELFFEIISICR